MIHVVIGQAEEGGALKVRRPRTTQRSAPKRVRVLGGIVVLVIAVTATTGGDTTTPETGNEAGSPALEQDFLASGTSA